MTPRGEVLSTEKLTALIKYAENHNIGHEDWECVANSHELLRSQNQRLRAALEGLLPRVEAAVKAFWIPLEDQGGWPNGFGDALTIARQALEGTK